MPFGDISCCQDTIYDGRFEACDTLTVYNRFGDMLYSLVVSIYLLKSIQFKSCDRREQTTSTIFFCGGLVPLQCNSVNDRDTTIGDYNIWQLSL